MSATKTAQQESATGLEKTQEHSTKVKATSSAHMIGYVELGR